MIDFAAIRGRSGGLVQEDVDLLERIVRGLQPKTIVEIGGSDGASSMLFGLLAKEWGGHVWTIEPDVKRSHCRRWVANIQEMGIADCVTRVEGWSPWVDPNVVPHPIDFLFVDGDHRALSVALDAGYWLRFVRRGGLVGFHDFHGGMATHVNAAIDVVKMQVKLTEVGRAIARDRGTIVFEKGEDPW